MQDSGLPFKQDPGQAGEPLSPVAGISDQALEAALKVRSTQQALLVEVNAALAAAVDAEDVLSQILALLIERTRLINASIFLLDPAKGELRCVAQAGYANIESIRTLWTEGPGLIAWVARSRGEVYAPDVFKDPRYLIGDARAKSEYAVPLIVGSTLLGVLDIESDQVDGIRAVTRKLLDHFAGQAAMAIERSELYKKLRASEQRFRSVFEQSPLGVALCDLEGRFFEINTALAQTLGYEIGELQGKHFFDITHPEDRPRSAESAGLLLDGMADRFALEKRYVRKSGESVWCNTTVSLIRGPAGEPAYLLAIVQDITESRRGEQERARLMERLFQAQKMEALGSLAGGIAHDFNNLLGVILGYVSLVRTRLPRQDPMQETVAMMEQSASRAAELTDELLQFARQEKPLLRPLAIARVLGAVLKIVTQTFDRRIRIDAQLPPELPWVEGDPGQLELAILNLCINARDAMPEGGTLTLEASVVALAPENLPPDAQGSAGEYVRIIIRDSGVGMEPQVLQRVFEPFFTTKESGKGSGLGLSLVQGIVSRHGGFIGVRSQEGHGSEFTLHLPVTSQPAEPAREETPLAAEHGTGTVLVVDDEPLMLSFTAEAVRELGYKVVTAEDGARAREVFSARSPDIDIVLLDMIMPGKSWVDTLHELQAINPQAKLILTSGYSSVREARRALQEGAVAFIGKPYTIDALARILRVTHLGGSGEAGGGPASRVT
ncbi:MAG: PAS domain S-box protein [Acidobacteriia bacterium]|nr:PAS domain S-box protein [Terriglobia bacterium]